jgi:hypothetical protein
MEPSGRERVRKEWRSSRMCKQEIAQARMSIDLTTTLLRFLSLSSCLNPHHNARQANWLYEFRLLVGQQPSLYASEPHCIVHLACVSARAVLKAHGATLS